MSIRKNLQHVVGLALGAAALASGQTAIASAAHADVTSIYDAPYVTSANNSTALKSVTAYCPSGLVVLGGGAEIGGGADNVYFRTLTPLRNVSTGRYGYQAIAVAHHGYTGIWQVSVHALCTAAPPGYELRESISASGSNWFASTSTACSTGKQILAAGGSTRTASGLDSHVTLLGLQPSPAATGSAHVWAQEDGAFSGTWDLVSTAVCATQPPGYISRDVAGTTTSSTQEWANAGCPTGTRVYSAGGWSVVSAQGTSPAGLVEVEALPQGQLALFGAASHTPASLTGVNARVICGR